MKLLASRWIPLAVAITVCIMAATQPLHAEVKTLTKKVAGTTVHYKFLAPYLVGAVNE